MTQAERNGRNDAGQASGPGEDRPARRRRKEARPGEIIAAGLAEFAANGFAATRLEDVARRAGIAKGTIYRYFASKEELFEAAVIDRLSPVLGNLDALVDSFPGTAEELLRMAIARLHQALFQEGREVLLRILITEGARFPQMVETYHRTVIARGKALLARIVARGIEEGSFAPSAATTLPVTLVSPAVMAVVWRMLFEHIDPVPAEAFAAAHADLVLDGLRARDPGDDQG